MSEHFELLDVFKALISILAGLILGFEREMKDKSAGLKTITVICLGSTLFSILSYKVSGSGDPARIASYIVSGIGFLGAGVIFKEGFTVYGLTTAGVIWIAAAVGMAIGFGEVYIAFTFMISAIFIIYSAKYLTKHLLPLHHHKILRIRMSTHNFMTYKTAIVNDLKAMTSELSEIGIEKEYDHVLMTLEIHISEKQTGRLENFLTTNKNLDYFSY